MQQGFILLLLLLLVTNGIAWTRELQQNGQLIQTLDPICQSPPHKFTFPLTDAPLSKNYSRGIPSSTAHFPFIVSLQIFDEIDGIFVHFCGGVLLSPDIVLTPAHCVQGDLMDVEQIGKVRNDLIYGVFAALNPFCRHQAGDQGRISAQDFIIPESYQDFGYLGNDIALIRLPTPFDYEGPYPTLETGDSLPNGTKAFSAGWGYISAEEVNDETLYFETATYMRLKSFNFVPQEQCGLELERDIGFINILSETQLCFKSPIYANCKGDSGGPLAIYEYDAEQDKLIWKLLGLDSWGVAADCNTTGIDVFVKISKLVDWINENQKILSAAPTPTGPVGNSSSVTTNATNQANVFGDRSTPFDFQDAFLNIGPSFLLKIQVRYWDQNESQQKLSFCSGVLVEENWALMSYSCYLRISQFASDCERPEVSCPNPPQLHKWLGDTNQQCFDIETMQNMQIEVNAMGYFGKSFRESTVPQFGVVFNDFEEIYINPENELNNSVDNIYNDSYIYDNKQNDSFPVYVNDFLLLKLQGQFDNERLKGVKISAFDNLRKNLSYKILFQNSFYQEDIFWRLQFEQADVISESENEDFICSQKLQDSVCVQNQTICNDQNYVCGVFEFQNSTRRPHRWKTKFKHHGNFWIFQYKFHELK